MTDTAIKRCRSCGALVIWLENDSTGRRAPIDAVPSAEGNCHLDRDVGSYRVLNPDRAAMARNDGERLHLVHHITCPDGPAWRRRA